MPKGIHTRGTPIGVHTVDFLIWIPDRSRFGDRNQRYEYHLGIHRLQDFEIGFSKLSNYL